jgi:flagellar motor switch protein FliN/FliY
MADESTKDEKDTKKLPEGGAKKAAAPVVETPAAKDDMSAEEAEQAAAWGDVGADSPEKAPAASFDELSTTGEPTNVNDNVERILDIPITIAVEVGRVKMLINDLLQLGHGSVIELDKAAGEPMEILVNDRLVAKGEVVAVNEKFGIRLTDIISPIERIKQLRK